MARCSASRARAPCSERAVYATVGGHAVYVAARAARGRRLGRLLLDELVTAAERTGLRLEGGHSILEALVVYRRDRRDVVPAQVGSSPSARASPGAASGGDRCWGYREDLADPLEGGGIE
jgi:GNAT superfamily N-acetyltransferase